MGQKYKHVFSVLQIHFGLFYLTPLKFRSKNKEALFSAVNYFYINRNSFCPMGKVDNYKVDLK